MQHLLDIDEANGNNRNGELRAEHPDAGPERLYFAAIGPAPFGKNQNREAAFDQIAGVSQGLPCARLALWKRKRVEERRRQPVIQAVCKPLSSRELFGE